MAGCLQPPEMAYGTSAELDQQAPLSRATETLVFVDVAAGDAERELSLELLRDPAPYDPEDLVDHFTHAEASPDERVLARTNDARVLIDSAPGRAWQRVAGRRYGCWGIRICRTACRTRPCAGTPARRCSGRRPTS